MTIQAALVCDCWGVSRSDRASITELASIENGFIWVDVSDPSRDELVALQVAYTLSPLAMTEQLAGPQAPYVEEQAGELLLTLPSAGGMSEGGCIVVLGADFIVSASYGSRHGQRRLRDRIERDNQPSLAPTDILGGLLAQVVAEYDDALDILQDRVVALSRAMLDWPEATPASGVLIALRSNVRSMSANLYQLATFLDRSGNVAGYRPVAEVYGELPSLFRKVHCLSEVPGRLLEALDAAESYNSVRTANDRRRKAWLASGFLGSIACIALIHLIMQSAVSRPVMLLLGVCYFAARTCLVLCVAVVLLRNLRSRSIQALSPRRGAPSRR